MTLTRKDFLRSLIPISAMPFLLPLAGCGVLSELSAIIDAADAALPVLAAAGVPIPLAVIAYVGDVANCVGQQNTSTAPTSTQLLQIAACLAGMVSPSLTGLPAAIVNVIAQVVKDVEAFLASNPPAAASAKMVKAGTSLTGSKLAQYNQIKQHAVAVAVKAQVLTKKLNLRSSWGGHALPNS